MRRMGKAQSEAYQQKALVSRVVWTIVLLFVLYSAYAVGKPYFVMWWFERKTDAICDEKRLSDRDLDFEPIITEIYAAAGDMADWGVSMPEDGVVCRKDGGINHISVKYSTKGSWMGVEWEPQFEAKYMSAKKRVGY